MKTLIATAIIALASGTASADYLSFADSTEFYSGQENSSVSTQSHGIDASQFLEGNYAGIIQNERQDVQGDRIGHTMDNTNLYVEGNYDV